MINGLDEQYIDLLKDILENGVEKNTRNGKVLSVFGRSIRYKFKDGKFPLLTTKKMYWKGIVTELLWFLRGDTNIKYLVDNNCHIWDGDCFSNYLKKRDRFSNKDNVKEDVVINGINGSSNRAYTKEEFINKIKTDDEFAEKWGDLGPIYGKQWRNWEGYKKSKEFFYHNDVKYHNQTSYIKTDQIANLINDLKTNPDSRRLMVSAWNVGELDQMVLPPCHYGFQVYTRELDLDERVDLLNTKTHRDLLKGIRWDNFPENLKKPVLNALIKENIPTRAISLMWNQRSVDVPLGLPFNIASYGLLLEIIAKMVNMVPDQLIGNLGDCHIYSNQIDGCKEQLTRTPFELPSVILTDKPVNDISEYTLSDIVLENYQSHPPIKLPLSN